MTRTSPSGKDGGTLNWGRRYLGGLDDRSEFDRATFDVLGIPFVSAFLNFVSPRTMVYVTKGEKKSYIMICGYITNISIMPNITNLQV